MDSTLLVRISPNTRHPLYQKYERQLNADYLPTLTEEEAQEYQQDFQQKKSAGMKLDWRAWLTNSLVVRNDTSTKIRVYTFTSATEALPVVVHNEGGATIGAGPAGAQVSANFARDALMAYIREKQVACIDIGKKPSQGKSHYTVFDVKDNLRVAIVALDQQNRLTDNWHCAYIQAVRGRKLVAYDDENEPAVDLVEVQIDQPPAGAPQQA